MWCINRELITKNGIKQYTFDVMPYLPTINSMNIFGERLVSVEKIDACRFADENPKQIVKGFADTAEYYILKRVDDENPERKCEWEFIAVVERTEEAKKKRKAKSSFKKKKENTAKEKKVPEKEVPSESKVGAEENKPFIFFGKTYKAPPPKFGVSKPTHPTSHSL